MTTYSVHYEDSGFIISTVTSPINFTPVNVEGINSILVESGEKLTPNTHYVKNGQVLPLQDFPLITQDIQKQETSFLISLSSLPLDTKVIWPDGVVTFESDGLLECELTYPGTYIFYLTHVYYLPIEVIVNVTS